jgi:hypothetical protein
VCARARNMMKNKIFFIFSIIFLIVFILSSVLADQLGCCEKTGLGDMCRYTSTSDCDQSLRVSPNVCEDTEFCKIGHCFYSDEGTCSSGAPKANCGADNGEWYEQKPNKCNKGCCLLGSNTDYVTEKRCSILAERLSFPTPSFDTSIEERACRYFTSVEGACLYGNGLCSFTNEETCLLQQRGEFKPGKYCSDPEFDLGYEEGENRCYDGNIYAYDDHGNREGIVENCLENGNRCKTDENGIAYCEDLRCYDEANQRWRDNLESWCIYDTYVGDSVDPVGSEHCYVFCKEGNIQLGGCSSYRNQVCAEKTKGAEVGPPTRIIDSADNEGDLFCPSGFEICGAQNNPYNNYMLDKIWCCPTQRTVNYNNKRLVDSADNQGDLVCPVGFSICGAQNNPYTNDKLDKIWCCPTQRTIDYADKRLVDSAENEGDLFCSYGFELCGAQNLFNSNEILDKIWCCKIEEENFDQGTSEAELRENLWKECSHIDDAEECDDHPDCRRTGINAENYFVFDACVPKYPPGFDIFSEDSEKNGQDICGLSNLDLTEIWDDDSGFRGKDDCFANCISDQGTKHCKRWWHCHSSGIYELEKFIGDVHNLCISLGDCGSWVNYVGEYSGNERYTFSAGYDNFLSGYWSQIAESFPNIDYDSIIFKENVLGPVGNTPQPLPQQTTSRFNDAPESFGRINGLMPGDFVPPGGDFDRKEYHHIFYCDAWETPSGGDNCHLCNDPLIPCSEYRCQSLGAACRILEETKSPGLVPVCIDAYSEDVLSPEISFGTISSQYVVGLNQGNIDAFISLGNNECPLKNDPVSFTLKTNEIAKCITTTDISNANYELEHEHSYGLTHSVQVYLSVDDEIYLHTFCQDPAGNRAEFITKICIDPRPDISAPILESFSPPSGSYLAFGETNKGVSIRLNEPAECRYSTTPNTAFENMNNYFCETDSGGIGPHFCSTILYDLTENTNTFYIRCIDELNNFNQQDKRYTLFATTTPLEVDIISPENKSVIERPINSENPLELTARTSGGAYSGKANCTWRFVNQPGHDKFTTTGSTTHNYEFTSRLQGDYTIRVTCKDKAGNTAKNTIQFTAMLDEEPPRLVNASVIGEDMFRIFTDEDAACYYRASENEQDEDCLFELDASVEGTEDITPGYWFNAHTITEFSKRKYYYVKCVDEWDNPGCVLIIEPTDRDDNQAPKIVRVRHSRNTNQLVIITNKDAVCYYRTDGCDFPINEDGSTGVKMTCNEDYCETHSTMWDADRTYHIKCIDSWGNSNDECAMTVKPSELG